jgi:signal transduction histidine kinase
MTASQSRILIVDDEETGRYVKARILRRAGHVILEAGEGAAALRIVKEQAPALVLLDVKLPDMSGLDVCRDIKRIDPSILVLQTSAAFTGKGDKAAGLAGGADAYLVEPVEPEELTSTITALLRLRQAEQSLRRANEGLEQKVLERTRELEDANAQLTAAALDRAKAEEIIRHTQKLDVLGQLTGGIAHDFNNLLMIILGNLETTKRQFARGEPDRKRIDQSIENAVHGARRAAALTQQLLAFSRRQPLAAATTGVDPLVAGLSDVLRRTLGEQVTVEVALSADRWTTYVDRNLLESALLNLAINARDAMPNGGKLTIRTGTIELEEPEKAGLRVPPGQYVTLEVIDTGDGMNSDTAAHAFEPFFTTKDVGHGTGLGLSQVYGFVTQSGGEVTLHSEPGKGTRITIYLPANLDKDATPIPLLLPDETVQGAGEIILMVEDDTDVRNHTTGVLTELGYRVVEAGNGKAALALLKSRADIALLFTDVGLPGGMSGLQLAEEAEKVRPDLPILLTTGYGLTPALSEAGVLADGRLLRKPFTYSELALKLRELLGSPPKKGD